MFWVDVTFTFHFLSEVGDIDYDIQKHNSPGFIGCISGVRYNTYAPLKAFFRPNETDPPVTTQGYISESICGAFPPVLGYVPWEADPWFTGIGEYIWSIMQQYRGGYNFINIILCLYTHFCTCFSEYYYIHDDLGLVWLTGKTVYSSSILWFFNDSLITPAILKLLHSTSPVMRPLYSVQPQALLLL